MAPMNFPLTSDNRLATGSLQSSPPRAMRGLRGAAAAVLLAWAGPALAGAGLGLLNAVATLRGHQGPADQSYGPLERQRFDIYRPGASKEPADAATGTPLIIFLYGGSWSMGSRSEYRFAGEALAAQGFTVMVVDYRLYPEVHYPDFLQDCARAVAYGLEHAADLGADPRRVFLFGHSAGAYNAAMLALDPRWLRARGHSPNELAGWVGLAGPYNFLPIGDPGVRLVFDWPATSPDTQPINHVADLARPLPVFLGAAARDETVHPAQNTEPLADDLRARGAALTLKIYDRVNHATLAGALSWPLTALAPVLADTTAFIRATSAVLDASGRAPVAAAR